MNTTDALSFVSVYRDLAMSLAIQYVPHFVLAILVLFVGFRLVRMLTSMMDRALHSQRVDPSLRSFSESAVGVILKILVLMTVANMIGVQMTSFIAFLGAIGLAVGLSLQGSLSNLAGGILILFFKPFRVGDTIIAQGQEGTVMRIEMFSTTLRGDDGRTIVIPNGALSNNVIVNLSQKS